MTTAGTLLFPGCSLVAHHLSSATIGPGRRARAFVSRPRALPVHGSKRGFFVWGDADAPTSVGHCRGLDLIGEISRSECTKRMRRSIILAHNSHNRRSQFLATGTLIAR